MNLSDPLSCPYFIEGQSIFGTKGFEPFTYGPDDHFWVVVGVEWSKLSVELAEGRERERGRSS